MRDFGIVVLSKPFFAKKWPTAELDGFFGALKRSHAKTFAHLEGITEDEAKILCPRFLPEG